MSIGEGQQLTGLEIAVTRELYLRVIVRPSGSAGSSFVDRYDVVLQHRDHTSERKRMAAT